MVEEVNLTEGDPIVVTPTMFRAGLSIATSWQVKKNVNESSASLSAACAWYELSTWVREI